MSPTPGRGWLLKNGMLETNWMTQKPAPDTLLEFLSCGCKKSGCQNNMCVCIANGLKCTDICSYYECTNCLPDEDHENGSDTFDSDTEDQSWNYTMQEAINANSFKYSRIPFHISVRFCLKLMKKALVLLSGLIMF